MAIRRRKIKVKTPRVRKFALRKLKKIREPSAFKRMGRPSKDPNGPKRLVPRFKKK